MLESFKKDILNDVDSGFIAQKYLIDGDSFFFREFYPDDEFVFKKGLADVLDVHIRDISIVGSGKLGFSLKPDNVESSLYHFKKFDYDFALDFNADKSDLDIAIISEKLFEHFLQDIFFKTNKYRTIPSGWKTRKDFSFYALKGWFRKDFLFDGYEFENNLYEFLDSYKKKYKRDINIGIYKSWLYFEHYHINNIENIKINLLHNG